MTRKFRNEVLEVCGNLVGHARGAGRVVAVAVSERFPGRLFSGRGLVDVHQLQLALADEIEAMRARLAAWEDRYDRELERGGRLRALRGCLTTDIRATLLGLKRTFTGAYDAGTANRLLAPVRRLADAPAAVRRQAERFHATLTDPALELPPPGPGVEIDLALTARSFEEPMDSLGETLAELAECEAATRHAKARRDEELTRLAVFADRVARLYKVLYELAKHPRTARRGGAAE